MTFSYNATVPNGPDDPGDDQPFMLTNTVSIANLINVEHIGFNLTNGGIHRKVTMPLNTGVPPTNVGQLVLFNTNFGVGAPSQLLYSKDNTGTAVIMTGPQNPVAARNGYTFLLGPLTPVAGSIILQWGFVNGTHGSDNHFSAGDSGTVTFSTANIAFPNNCFNVFTQLDFTNGNAPASTSTSMLSINSSFTKFSFNWAYSAASGNSLTSFTWFAIGN